MKFTKVVMPVSSTGKISYAGVPLVCRMICETLNKAGRGYTVSKTYNGYFWRVDIKNIELDITKDAFFEFDIINHTWTDETST